MAVKHATIFAYQVGFGDCFLVRFRYENGARRHVLIDFGTTGLPEDVTTGHMRRVADDIRTKVEEPWLDDQGSPVSRAKSTERLDVLVATHRHADHISGFATTGANSGEVILQLNPRVVVQPWTEAPSAPVDWEGPIGERKDKAFNRRRRSLEAMHDAASEAVKFAGSAAKVSQRLGDELSFIGNDNIANRSAIENLQAMPGRHEYVFHGADPKLGRELPGIKVHVLGPPTLRQTEAIRKQRSRDVDEFWQFAPQRLAAATGVSNAPPLFPGAPITLASKLKLEQRWLSRRIDGSNAEIMLGIVRALDKQMNNTSVILLLEAGSKKLLFAGDAQLENWEYALSSEMASLLDDVNVLKVGHHGSLNATPRSLWARFKNKGKSGSPNRLTSVLSTQHGKHGSDEKRTEVPRRSLVAELEEKSKLFSTESLTSEQLHHTIEVDLR